MLPIDLRLDGNLGMTLLPNAFIDNYMKYANDAEIKVYLYLLRNLSAGRGVDITSMADCFNYSEKDIIRALLYWERWGVLSLIYASAKPSSKDDYASHSDTLVGIRLSPLQGSAEEPVCQINNSHRSFAVQAQPAVAAVTDCRAVSAVSGNTQNHDSRMTQDICSEILCSNGAGTDPAPTPSDKLFSGNGSTGRENSASESSFAGRYTEASAAGIRNSYTLDDMRAFRADTSYGFLFTAAQQYLGRPLTDPQMRSLIFMTKELKFSPELTDYLLQYCIGGGHKDFRYIESTAIGWAEQGITSEEEARSMTRSSDDDERIRKIMSLLGRSGKPAPQELRFICRWLNTYAFPPEIIEEACNRTVSAVDKNRFAYAESILAKWHEKGVREKKDITALDEEFLKSKGIPDKQKNAPRKNARTDAFNSFEQRKIDYDSLEHLLSGNGDKKD